MITVGLVQLAQDPTGPRPAPLAPALDGIRAAADAGADLVVLPELWRTGPFELDTTLTLAEGALPEVGASEATLAAHGAATAATLARAAREAGVWLHGGSVLERRGDHMFNTAMLFDNAGTLQAVYRKRHLFGFDTGEAALLSAGDDIVVVDTPLGPTGLATCYDLRFPEHFRTLVDAGAEAVLLTSGWPSVRIGHWRTLTAARAIEDQVTVVACNATGTSGTTALGGHSVVIDAGGTIVAEAGEGAETLVVAVDSAQPAATRAAFPVLRDRR